MAARSRRPRGASKWQRGASEPSRPGMRPAEETEEHRDGTWVVRRLRGSSGTADYRCPGCHGMLRPEVPHVVAWQAERPLLGGQPSDARRHWHSACWDRRSRTGR